MSYVQITSEERYMIAAMLWQGFSYADIARQTGRHRSTIGREVRRNLCNDGGYRAEKADSRTRGRRRRTRQGWNFSKADFRLVTNRLKRLWSPKQISGRLRLQGLLSISHETIYKFIRAERRLGGSLFTYLRHSGKKRRKRYGAPDSRGILRGKRHITERPPGAENRSRIGHWEIDTVMGADDRHCIVTMVERKTGYTLIGKLKARTAAELNRRVIKMIRSEERRVRSITADNGTEFHDYDTIERITDTLFFFANPHHSWERGTNENTNGLIRQYLPKRRSMAHITQRDCNAIAKELNSRPRQRLGFKTPEECYALL